MDKIIQLDGMQQEFAYVDSIITAHTNMAIAKVNAEQLQMYWEIGGFVSRHLKDSSWGDHVVSELADYLKRQNAKRRGYSGSSNCADTACTIRFNAAALWRWS